MSTRATDKASLPSRHVTEGTTSALHRTFYYAMGLDTDAIHGPIVGLAAAWTGSATAGDLPLRAATVIEQGVWAGGAAPRKFGTIADGSTAQPDLGAGNATLVGRELVADSVELTVRGHSYDGLIGVGACAGSLAGLALGACRLDVPAVLVPLVDPSFDSDEDAYAMAAMLEALGLTCPRAARIQSTSAQEEHWRAAGRQLGTLLQERVSPRGLLSAGSLRDAAAVLAAIGASPYLCIDLVAIAGECGLAVSLPDLIGTMERTPSLWASPAEAMGAASVGDIARRLAADGMFDLDRRTIAGASFADAQGEDPDAVGVPDPHRVGWLGGSLAPEGATFCAPPASPPSMRVKVRVFDGEEAACEAVHGEVWSPDTAIVVRGVGPTGAGMPRLAELARSVDSEPAISLVVTDGRLPKLVAAVGVDAVGPEAAQGGPLASVRDGSTIDLDLEAGTLECDVVDAGDSLPSPAGRPAGSAALAKYVMTAGPAWMGGVAHPGAGGERRRYADI